MNLKNCLSQEQKMRVVITNKDNAYQHLDITFITVTSTQVVLMSDYVEVGNYYLQDSINIKIENGMSK